MPYLIDGHNLIPKIPGVNLGDIDDEVHLIKVLQDFCRSRRTRVEVYFDNAPPGEARTQKHGQVSAYFVRRERTADDAIRSRLKNLGKAARNWTVVSSDQQVAAAAREAGAKVLSADEFSFEQLSNPAVQEVTPEVDAELSLNPDDVEDWMRLFGIEGEE
jgi:predicted RNA-binding protein with PIN domain